MKKNSLRYLLLLFLGFPGLPSFAQTVSFTTSQLAGESLYNPTSLQFGPDGRLYVSQQNGLIYAYTIVRYGPNDYRVTATEAITLIQQIPNHNDDGSLAPNVNTRQVTGILVTGTPANPVIYVSSSDPRIGGGSGATNKNLDTNSGIVSRLTWNGSQWEKIDLVRGLPRSEENHSINGMQLDPVNQILYLAQGGNTNMGAPSNNFVFLPEYAYSTAILAIHLNQIGNTTYDLPTLDDETRVNVSSTPGYTDPNDPFGGNDGKNQAMLETGGPVQIYSPGWRNNYDLVITQSGKMYSPDNGPNSGWGGPPTACSNNVSEPGSGVCDVLHCVTPGYYAGHPNPTRANRSNTFNSGANAQTPVPPGMENPVECTYMPSNSRPGALVSICASTNGICEYKASNFNNAMKGDLLLASFNNKIYRVKLNATGDALVPGGLTTLASNFGSTPLDVIAQGDNDPFPGTIWIVTYASHDIIILEPNDLTSCTGDIYSFALDSDGDGFTNGDETANGTDPCSPASKPSDADGDLLSDLVDADDDNDGIPDTLDRFALDPFNGYNTTIPVNYQFDNSNDGGILGWGFTGLMTNGSTDYLQLFDPGKMTVGGAALKFTVGQVPSGDAYQNLNDQHYAFQFGLNTSAAQWPFVVRTRVYGPFAGFIPLDYQSMGLFIGTGDQDNYLKIVCAANGGAGGIEIAKEEAGAYSSSSYNISILNKSYVDLFLHINPSTRQVQPRYALEGGTEYNLGPAIVVPPNWLNGILAVGIISTSRGSGQVFPATWDFIRVDYDPSSVLGQWYQIPSANSPVARHECSYVQAGNKFYLMGGRGNRPVQSYNPADSTWTTEASNPIEMHHFQAVEYNGLIYVMSAFTGSFPHETPLPNIYIYDPVAKQWNVGPLIPANRRRGAAGCVVYDNMIYVVCGIQDGHSSGWVPWLDRYDPQTNTWTQLPDAPRARDHFNAIVANGKIYCIGGRLSGFNGNTFKYVVPEVDVYDIASQTWTTLPAVNNIPTPRAACATALLEEEILVIGGEIETSLTALNVTEAFNYSNHAWRTLTPLITGRHATTAISSNGGVYVVCGSGNRGGSPELSTQEVFYFFNPTPPQGNQIVKGTLTPDSKGRYFGPLLLSDTSTKSFTLSNLNGNQVIMISSLLLTDSLNFSVNFPYSFPVLLGVHQTLAFEVKAHPAAPGIQDAALHIHHNGINNPLELALQVEGITSSCQGNCTPQKWFPDVDGDLFGYPFDSVISALQPTGFVLNNADCDDDNNTIYPGAPELPDSLDNNCNGVADEGFGPKKVLFVTGNTSLSPSDAFIKTRMEQLGYQVTVVSDASVATNHATGMDLIFISSTINSGNVGNKFTSVALPVINCEPYIFDDMKMTDNSTSNYGNIYTQTQINIINNSHPLAAGLSAGNKTVYNSSDRLVWGNPASSAIKIATAVGNSSQYVLFAYETGATMFGMTAPARRIGFFLYDTGAEKLNSNGVALLEAALQWATNALPQPQISITAPANGATFNEPATVNAAATASISMGQIVRVQFYLNNTVIHTDSTAPYNYTLTNLTSGSYTLHGVAFADNGLSATSAPVTFSVSASPPPPPPPIGGGQVLFVVGNTNLNSGDQAIYNRLSNAGYNVTIKSDIASSPADASGKNLVIISSTVLSGNMGNKFTNTTIPVLVYEPSLFDDMKMTGNNATNYGAVQNMNNITIINNTHPLAAGLSIGNTVIFNSLDRITYGNPSSSAIKIATLPGSSTQYALFAYENGATMSGLNAPARRVGFFLYDDGPAKLTTAGWQLFDAAITWAAPSVMDCHGDMGGSAFINSCGTCVGGNSGLEPNAGKDCHGECGGTAYINACGICVGGNTGLPDSAGIDCTGGCGSAVVNTCGFCVGGSTGLPLDYGIDCNNVCGGTAFLDSCGICSGGNTGHIPNSDLDSCGVCFGDGSSCAVIPCVQLEVVSFTLMGEGTSGEIGPLTNGIAINLATTGNFTIRANVCNDPVGSVKFILNGSTYRIENTPPYALNGDNPPGNFVKWNAAPGNYTLTAIPYSLSGGKGTAGIAETVTFTIVNQNNVQDCNGDIGGTAIVNSCGICVGGNTGHDMNAGKDCQGVCNGTAFIDDCGICSGGTTGHTPNSDKDACGICFGNGSTCLPCQPLQVTALTIMHAGTAGEIGPFVNGMTLNKSTLGSFSLRADLCDEDAAGSVKFVLNGSTYRIENAAPFAINGDSPAGNYNAWNVNPGNYTLSVIPYSGKYTSGTEGIPLHVQFTVIESAPKTLSPFAPELSEASQAIEVHIYPNPTRERFYLNGYVPVKQHLSIRLFNHMGQLLTHFEKELFSGELSESFSLKGQPAGLYYLQIAGSSTVINKTIALH
ncbi:MAG: hypothetical protein KatS3mg031_0251 [Chitinophagales bacterium]|nr:MAG: hypothetical protein KatS3mg031_0251 [Chitinophagales bacterium]